MFPSDGVYEAAKLLACAMNILGNAIYFLSSLAGSRIEITTGAQGCQGIAKEENRIFSPEHSYPAKKTCLMRLKIKFFCPYFTGSDQNNSPLPYHPCTIILKMLDEIPHLH